MHDSLTSAPGVVAEDLDDDICLYRADIDEVVVLNRSAGDVWRLVDGHRTNAMIAVMLADAYGIGREDLQEDVANVTADLVRRGYLIKGRPHRSVERVG